MANDRFKHASFAIAGLLVLSLFFFWGAQMAPSGKKRVALSAVIQEAEVIAAHPSTVLIDRVERHKGTSVLVLRKYQSPLSTEQVFNHYGTELRRAGWRYTGRAGGRLDGYCKGALEAEVEVNPQFHMVAFSVMWWARSKTVCEP